MMVITLAQGFSLFVIQWVVGRGLWQIARNVWQPAMRCVLENGGRICDSKNQNKPSEGQLRNDVLSKLDTGYSKTLNVRLIMEIRCFIILSGAIRGKTSS